MNFHFKNINDIKIAYKDVGKGKVIFCLPPFPSSSASFIPFINKVKKALGLKGDIGNLSQVKVAVLGLAFKPNTDDMRDAPSVKIINHLLDLGAQVTAYDPQAMENAKRILPKIEYAKDVYSAIKDKDVMVVVTEWPQFSQIDLARAKKLLRRPIIIDGRNMFDREKVKESGFSYFGIGR